LKVSGRVQEPFGQNVGNFRAREKLATYKKNKKKREEIMGENRAFCPTVLFDSDTLRCLCDRCEEHPQV
jgi:hypothetical protein